MRPTCGIISTKFYYEVLYNNVEWGDVTEVQGNYEKFILHRRDIISICELKKLYMIHFNCVNSNLNFNKNCIVCFEKYSFCSMFIFGVWINFKI